MIVLNEDSLPDEAHLADHQEQDRRVQRQESEEWEHRESTVAEKQRASQSECEHGDQSLNVVGILNRVRMRLSVNERVDACDTGNVDWVDEYPESQEDREALTLNLLSIHE